MSDSALRLFFASLLFILAAPLSHGFVELGSRGEWPDSWPAELEPFRERSLTAWPGMPLTEAGEHQIPFESREEFEKVWPAILGLRSKGAPITLVGIDPGVKRYGQDEWSNARPCVRIIGPPKGLLHGRGEDLNHGPPWPEELRDANGHLPTLVHHVKDADGLLSWAAGKGEIVSTRCRIELVLVVDGDIIDTDRLEFPADAVIHDGRKKAEAEP